MENKKITKAQNDAKARANAVEILKSEGLKNFLQVGNNSYAIDVANAEGKMTVTRIDIVIPKVEEGMLSADLESEYLDDKDIKEQEKLAKEQAKEKKIAKDKKTREKAKAEKGE